MTDTKAICLCVASDKEERRLGLLGDVSVVEDCLSPHRWIHSPLPLTTIKRPSLRPTTHVASEGTGWDLSETRGRGRGWMSVAEGIRVEREVMGVAREVSGSDEAQDMN